MRAYKRFTLVAVFVTLAIAIQSFPSHGRRSATTQDGEKVVLYDDGTWGGAGQLDVKVAPVVLPTPPVNESLARMPQRPPQVRLVKLSEQRNDITDDDAWFAQNGLTFPICHIADTARRIPGNCPSRMPATYRRNILSWATLSGEDMLLFYSPDRIDSRYVLVADRNLSQVRYALDFFNFMALPGVPKDNFTVQRITWAKREGSTLYVSNGHNTYAKSSAGKNAYLTAIDLDQNAVIWRSRPLVCNARNFQIIDDVIVCGYGFTAEPDFLYAVHKHSGRVLAKSRLKTGPDYILRKDDKLYVRTYNTNYVFKLQSAARKRRPAIAR